MKRLRAGLFLLFFMCRDIVHSSVLLAWDVLTRKSRFNIQLLSYKPISNTENELFTLTILIGLTPGTMVLDISDDRQTILIHALYAENTETILYNIKNKIEGPLLQVMRGARYVHGT